MTGEAYSTVVFIIKNHPWGDMAALWNLVKKQKKFAFKLWQLWSQPRDNSACVHSAVLREFAIRSRGERPCGRTVLVMTKSVEKLGWSAVFFL
jgi:hypothetical protein